MKKIKNMASDPLKILLIKLMDEIYNENEDENHKRIT
jgi:hypothetical protein